MKQIDYHSLSVHFRLTFNRLVINLKFELQKSVEITFQSGSMGLYYFYKDKYKDLLNLGAFLWPS